MSEWIKCSERLPYNGLNVLVLIKICDGAYKQAVSMRHKKNWFFYSDPVSLTAFSLKSSTFCPIANNSEVTHWQELPELPKD